MDANAITSLIGSVGFPIVMCLLMVKLMKDSEDNHKQEIDSLKDALNNNTQVLTKLQTTMDIVLKERTDTKNDA